MSRVYVIVEGQTEESFIKEVLAPSLWRLHVYLIPILLGPPGHKGGRTNYGRVRKDIVVLLKQDTTSHCSTMLDLYGLGAGFPGMPLPPNLANVQKAEHVEQSIKDDIVTNELDIQRPDVRLLPYLQLHEYEGLLFSDPQAFAAAIRQQHLAQRFGSVRNGYPTPEDIDDDPNTAPSRRVVAIYPIYRKVLDGTLAAKGVGIERMREECPHFRNWVERLEALA